MDTRGAKQAINAPLLWIHVTSPMDTRDRPLDLSRGSPLPPPPSYTKVNSFEKLTASAFHAGFHYGFTRPYHTSYTSSFTWSMFEKHKNVIKYLCTDSLTQRCCDFYLPRITYLSKNIVSAGIQHGTPKQKQCEIVGLYDSLDGCCLDARLDGLHDSESITQMVATFLY